MAAKKTAAKKTAAKKTTVSTSKKTTSASTGEQRTRVAAEQLPRKDLESAEKVAIVLRDVYASKSATLEQLAEALQQSAGNTNFKYTVWAAGAYGLVIKDDNTGKITLAETGRKIVKPTVEGEDREARIKAIQTPAILSSFYTTYNGNPIPAGAYLPNVLETQFQVPHDRVQEAETIILANAKYAGILQEREGQQPIIHLASAATDAPDAPKVSANPIPPVPDASDEENGGEDWSNVCFFITPIGEDGSEIRKHADMILNHLVKPVAEEHNLKVVRADHIGKQGLITRQILQHIACAKLCIADMSWGNSNVFYELGVRHMTHLPSVQFIKKGDKIPFDVAQGRTITVDLSDIYALPDRLDSARRELSEHVKNALASSDGKKPSDDNPIAVYLPGLKVVFPSV